MWINTGLFFYLPAVRSTLRLINTRKVTLLLSAIEGEIGENRRGDRV